MDMNKLLHDMINSGKSKEDITQEILGTLDKAYSEVDEVKSIKYGNKRKEELAAIASHKPITAEDVALVITYYMIDNFPSVDEEIKTTDDFKDKVTETENGISKGMESIQKMLDDIKPWFAAKDEDKDKDNSCKVSFKPLSEKEIKKLEDFITSLIHNPFGWNI